MARRNKVSKVRPFGNTFDKPQKSRPRAGSAASVPKGAVLPAGVTIMRKKNPIFTSLKPKARPTRRGK